MSSSSLSSILISAAVTTSAVAAHDNDPQLMALTAGELKSEYLRCEHAAARIRLDASQVMHCSVVYEALKRRAFDNDFEKLMVWFKAQPPLEGVNQTRRP